MILSSVITGVNLVSTTLVERGNMAEKRVFLRDATGLVKSFPLSTLSC